MTSVGEKSRAFYSWAEVSGAGGVSGGNVDHRLNHRPESVSD